MLETQFIKKLQQKSEATKKIVMWFGVFFTMAAIFTFWILTFPSQIPSAAESNAATNLKKELPTTFNSLKYQVSEFFNLFK